MHIVSISLDRGIGIPENQATIRATAYAKLVDVYTVFVPTTERICIQIAQNFCVIRSGGIGKFSKLWNLFRQLHGYLSRHSVDVLTVQDPYFLGFMGLMLTRYHRLGLEIQVHGFEKLSFVRRMLAKRVLRGAHAIRVPSRRLAARLVDEFEVSREKIAIVPVYVDVDAIKEMRSVLATEEIFQSATREFKAQYMDRCNVLTVSRLVPIKNLSMQLQAIAILVAEYPSLVLHIVGEGPDKKRLQFEVEQYKLQKNVVFHGWKSGPELWALYDSSDVFTLTSDYEGWGMVIVEAAIAGLPILMTNVGCAGEFVIHKKSALVVSPRDIEAFTAALCRLVSEPSLRTDLAVGATHALTTLPSFEETLSKYKMSWECAAKKVSKP